MRQEPKIYESTKPKEATVDTTVVEAHIADDGFHDMVNRFFQKIYTFLKWNFSGDRSDRGYDYRSNKYFCGYTSGQHMAMGDPFGVIGTTQYKD